MLLVTKSRNGVLIEVQTLSHTYATGTPLARTALRDVTLRITPSERVGVAGHTGSGKSTLMQHLAGLLKPTSGRVLLDGVPAHERSTAARSRRHRIGIAFQYPEEQIFEQTVFAEIAFGPRNMGLRQGELAARVDWALKLVGLDPLPMLDRSPFTLSGGERRRVALASVLAMRPEVLILDEPTAGLDPRGREELLERITAWPEDRKLTLIVVSHDLAALATMVERVIVLQAGRVEADGAARSVLSNAAILSSAGLRPPPPVALLSALRQTGWLVPTDRLTSGEATAEIAREWWRRQGAGLMLEESR